MAEDDFKGKLIGLSVICYVYVSPSRARARAGLHWAPTEVRKALAVSGRCMKHFGHHLWRSLVVASSPRPRSEAPTRSFMLQPGAVTMYGSPGAGGWPHAWMRPL